MDVNTNNDFFIGLPTQDGRAVVVSCLELVLAGRVMQRMMRMMLGETSDISKSRNIVMDQVRNAVGKNEGTVWVLWLDSDIVLPPNSHQLIVNAIRWSEATGKAWVANYKMSDRRNVIIKQRGYYNTDFYTDEEIAALPPYAEIGMGGFGLAYLPMDLSYVFHSDRWGEDIHFFMDQPNLKIHLAKEIVINHKKMVLL